MQMRLLSVLGLHAEFVISRSQGVRGTPRPDTSFHKLDFFLKYMFVLKLIKGIYRGLRYI